MNIAMEIRNLAAKYRDLTAKNLSEVVKIPSTSCNEEGVINKLAEQCRAAGFDEVYTDKLGNLIAKIGNGPKVLAFDAHIDTVDTGELDQWELSPFSGLIKDDYVFGRGTVDQEGGAAAMISAGKILKELNYNGEYTLYFVFTVQEEDCDGMCWRHIVEVEKLVPDFVVITEPTNLAVYRGHRGRMEMEVYFYGVSSHGSMPERGDNAIYKASRFCLEVEKLNERLAYDEFLGKGTVTATLFQSSSPSLCAVSDYVRVHLDRRLTWGETKESAVNEIKALLCENAKVEVPMYSEKSYKGSSFTQEKYFPTWKYEEGHPLVQAGKETYELLFDENARIDKWTFSTNGVAICGVHNIPAIGFGPGNEIYAHAPNEKVPVEHLEKASAFYALLPYILEKTTKE